MEYLKAHSYGLNSCWPAQELLINICSQGYMNAKCITYFMVC